MIKGDPSFSPGSNSDYKVGYIDTTGKEVIPCQYGTGTPFIDGNAVVMTSNGHAIIDKTGKVTTTLTQEQYERICARMTWTRVDYNWAEGMFVACSNESGRDRWGFIDATGKTVVPCKYQSVKSFSCGVAPVQDLSGKWGLVDTTGKEIMACQYDDISGFSNGIAVTRIHVNGNQFDRRYGLIDPKGQELLPCKYRSLDHDTFFAALDRGDKDIYLVLDHDDGVDIVHVVPDAPAQPVTPGPAAGSFTDVAADSPYRDAILWAVEKQITNGTSATTFSPDRTCTVRQILTFLWRANGRPGAVDGLSDLDTAVSWAVAQGLLDANADPDAGCTRSMAVLFMWKNAGSPTSSKTVGFSDVAADAAYAQAISWAVEKGITNGTSPTTFSPDKTCTRGQIVTFLYREMT